MIDHAKEQLISFAQAAKRLPAWNDGRSVSPNTIARWARNGIKGVLLESIHIGRRQFTSVEACQRFFAALTAAASPPSVQHSEKRMEDIEAVRRELKSYGI